MVWFLLFSIICNILVTKLLLIPLQPAEINLFNNLYWEVTIPRWVHVSRSWRMFYFEFICHLLLFFAFSSPLFATNLLLNPVSSKGFYFVARLWVTMIRYYTWRYPMIPYDTAKIQVSQGLPGLNKLISTLNDTPAKVLKRKRIRTIDDYYIIEKVISDTSNDISEDNRRELEKIFNDFESNYNKTKNAS